MTRYVILLGATIFINAEILLLILETADADAGNRHTHKHVAFSVDFALNMFKGKTPEK